MVITEHAYRRAKERLGLNRDDLTRMAALARARGVYTRWLEFDFMFNLEGFKHDNANGITRVLYQGAGFLFRGDRLVTVVRLDPRVLAKLSEYLELLNELIKLSEREMAR